MKKTAAACLLFLLITGNAFPFTFSDDEQEEAREKAAKSQRIEKLISVPCKDSLKGKKIAVIIGERHSGGGMSVKQSKYGFMFEIINGKLQDLGLRTYRQEDITRQIAEAEIKAFMNNDPDAALNAAHRLGADFVLRGLISTRSHVNPVLHVNEVFVDMTFTLTRSSGRTISGTTARADSYAGSDTISVAQTLVEEQADEIVAKLYSDFCRKGL